jgi:hypothetical protein
MFKTLNDCTAWGIKHNINFLADMLDRALTILETYNASIDILCFASSDDIPLFDVKYLFVRRRFIANPRENIDFSVMKLGGYNANFVHLLL